MSKPVLTKRLRDKTSKAVLTKRLPDKMSADQKLLGLCWTVGLRSKNLDKDESVKQVGCLSVGGLISD